MSTPSSTSAALQLPPVIFLMGPTASGKTDLALALAEQYPIEVISVDSALVYRGMDIGTAKPDHGFLQRLPHFLIDVCEPDEVYSVAQFRKDALALIASIIDRGNVPLLVGGTMLYFKVLLEGIAEIPRIPEGIRESILNQAERLGWPALHERLREVDPVSAARIHPNHSQRIQRALEVFEAFAEPLSAFHARQQGQALPFRALQLCLDVPRDCLHQRIALRFDAMIAKGFIDEVQQLRQDYELHQNMPSMRAVGYRQVWQYLDGEISVEELREQGCAATRQLAKRQLTWLRKWSDLHRISGPLEIQSGVDPSTALQKQLALIRPLCDQFHIPANRCVYNL